VKRDYLFACEQTASCALQIIRVMNCGDVLTLH